MLPATGSSRTAATWPGNRANASATALALLNGTSTVSAVAPSVTPGLFGWPSVVAPDPATRASDPVGRATFGMQAPEVKRVIHVREVFN